MHTLSTCIVSTLSLIVPGVLDTGLIEEPYDAQMNHVDFRGLAPCLEATLSPSFFFFL